MKRLLTVVILLVALSIVLIGCQGEEDPQAEIPTGEPIEVELWTEPEENLSAGEPFDIYIDVTQEGESIEADRVVFEFWDEEDEAAMNEEDADHEEGHNDEGNNEGHNGSENDHADMNEHESDNEMIDAEHVEDGVYMVTRTYDEPGTYYVMYHVDAAGFHAMTSHELEVE